MFPKKISPPSTGFRNRLSTKPVQKAGGKQTNWPAEIMDCVGKSRHMVKQNSVPAGFSVGHNETATPLW
jgi:hypothetical protein